MRETWAATIHHQWLGAECGKVPAKLEGQSNYNKNDQLVSVVTGVLSDRIILSDESRVTGQHSDAKHDASVLGCRAQHDDGTVLGGRTGSYQR